MMYTVKLGNSGRFRSLTFCPLFGGAHCLPDVSPTIIDSNIFTAFVCTRIIASAAEKRKTMKVSGEHYFRQSRAIFASSERSRTADILDPAPTIIHYSYCENSVLNIDKNPIAAQRWQ